MLHHNIQEVPIIGSQKKWQRVYHHGWRNRTDPTRSRLHRPKAAQQGGMDPTQMEGPEGIHQASRDGGRGHEEDTGSPGHRRQNRGLADARSAA